MTRCRAALHTCSDVVFVALVGVSCSAPEPPPAQPRPGSVGTLDPSVTADVRPSTIESTVATTFPEVSNAPLSSEPPEDDMVAVRAYELMDFERVCVPRAEAESCAGDPGGTTPRLPSAAELKRVCLGDECREKLRCSPRVEFPWLGVLDVAPREADLDLY